MQSKIQQIRSEIRNIGKSPTSTASTTASKPSELIVDQMRSQYAATSKVRPAVSKAGAGKGSDDALSKLKAFEKKISSSAPAKRDHAASKKSREEEENWVCQLHGVKKCKSCRDWDVSDGADDDDDIVDWANVQFTAAKTSANVYEPKVGNRFCHCYKEQRIMRFH